MYVLYIFIRFEVHCFVLNKLQVLNLDHEKAQIAQHDANVAEEFQNAEVSRFVDLKQREFDGQGWVRDKPIFYKSQIIGKKLF